METSKIQEIVSENNSRLAALAEKYDPLTGAGCYGPRVEISTPVPGLPRAFVPKSMLEDPDFAYAKDPQSWRILRCRHDFEYWCISCVTIKPKKSYTRIPFCLNRAQRKVFAELERDRLLGRPMRLIILKARQWGCSTLIQSFMAWIQMCIRPNWNSVICCQNKDSAKNIRNMYTKLIELYPLDLFDSCDESKPRLAFKPFEGSTNVREITGRSCRVAITSAENQDSLRGYDFAMAHLSEAAYWADTAKHSPDDIIRNIAVSVADIPYSLVVIESTANGIGDFFYEEWQRAKAGKSDKRPVFVAWYEIEGNSTDLEVSPEEFAATLTDEDMRFWNLGCTLQQIFWRREQARKSRKARQMITEFPTDDSEAFGATNDGVFDAADIERLHAACFEPMRECHIIAGRLVDSPGAEFKVWCEPDPAADYVVAVDIGGRSLASDWSVIAVMRRGDLSQGIPHQVVAQWRGHIDHDLLGVIAVVIARRYNEALLVIESNTLESGVLASFGGFVLERIADVYSNIYRRETSDSGLRIGFHTNRSTKSSIISGLIEAVREGHYVERCADACYEFAVYNQLPDGSYAAKPGYHDDMLMTRAIALHALADTPPQEHVPPLSAINVVYW